VTEKQFTVTQLTNQYSVTVT